MPILGSLSHFQDLYLDKKPMSQCDAEHQTKRSLWLEGNIYILFGSMLHCMLRPAYYNSWHTTSIRAIDHQNVVLMTSTARGPTCLSSIVKFTLVIPTVFRIHRAALWILGEYCTTTEEIQSLMNEIRNSLGEIPIVEDEMRKAAGENTEGIEEDIRFFFFKLYLLKCILCVCVGVFVGVMVCQC